MKKISFLIVFMAIALVSNAQNTVELRLNLPKGQTFKQNMDMKMNIKMEVHGIKIDTEVPFFTLISYRVTEVKDQNFTLEASYDVIRMKMNIIGQNLEFDSENPDKDNPLNAFLGMIGKKFLMTLDKFGNVVKVEGLEKLFDEILNGKNFTEEQKNQMMLLIADLFSEDKIKENFSLSTVVFPEEPVTEGFGWEAEIKQNISDMNMLVFNKFKVEKINAETVEISCISDYKMDFSLEQNGTTANAKLENAQAESSYVVDIKTGWTKSATSKSDMVIQMTANGISFPMQITYEFTVK
ncbi:MAG: DUF6263 family protein [Prevotellaceae bacterium]|jgi:hypothetical protein|nr:DUF6263 family protein [Prevotellaceae bacterium]